MVDNDTCYQYHDGHFGSDVCFVIVCEVVIRAGPCKQLMLRRARSSNQVWASIRLRVFWVSSCLRDCDGIGDDS